MAVVAFSLVAFFAVIPSMSLGLLPPPEGGLTGTIDSLLSQLFGWGKVVLPIAGFSVGVWLMVQSFDATGIELDYFRMIGMLALFACGLTWIHMLELMDDPAPTVEAFRPMSYAAAIDEGHGGGWFGHTFYLVLLSQLGDYGTLSVLVAWLVVGLMLTFDVSVVELGRYLVTAFTLVGVRRGPGRARREARRA
ncbi:MAG: DNA translocase FtsK 4TM domain-containing protein [Sandaracinaceae bacterium]|nr:DNA translocase FtsK 4TM domain-containing protein [Sandaracinaceae bacterium]